MPVGLSLLETVEERLSAEGLLPRDVSVLHRMIDFANRDFTLRWSSAETRGYTVTVRLTQQLAQTKVIKPMVLWAVFLEEGERHYEEGRVLLESTVRPLALAETVATTCQRLLEAAGESEPAS